jgi:hypothetical protein
MHSNGYAIYATFRLPLFSLMTSSEISRAEYFIMAGVRNG